MAIQQTVNLYDLGSSPRGGAIGGSYNGNTPGFGPGYRGSNPCPPARPGVDWLSN